MSTSTSKGGQATQKLPTPREELHWHLSPFFHIFSAKQPATNDGLAHLEAPDIPQTEVFSFDTIWSSGSSEPSAEGRRPATPVTFPGWEVPTTSFRLPSTSTKDGDEHARLPGPSPLATQRSMEMDTATGQEFTLPSFTEEAIRDTRGRLFGDMPSRPEVEEDKVRAVAILFRFIATTRNEEVHSDPTLRSLLHYVRLEAGTIAEEPRQNWRMLMLDHVEAKLWLILQLLGVQKPKSRSRPRKEDPRKYKKCPQKKLE